MITLLCMLAGFIGACLVALLWFLRMCEEFDND